MKLPSLFRTANYQRFDIKPRYYDPVKEEIEERTSRIRRELASEGVIEDDVESHPRMLSGGIRGSFSQKRGGKSEKKSVFDSASMIRLVFFFALIIGVFGYIYIGPMVFNYLLYGAVGLGVCYFMFKFLKRGRRR